MNISRAADTSPKKSCVVYTELKEKKLQRLRYVSPLVEYCNVFNGIYSKNAQNENFFQNVIFNKKKMLPIKLLDREGNIPDSVDVLAKRKK